MKNIELKLTLLVGLVAVLGIIGWANNWILFTSLKAIYVPIAPLAAVLLIFTSIAYVTLFKVPNKKIVSKSVSFLAVLNILIASFSFIDYFMILNWDFEEVFFANMITDSITGQISPLAAVLILIANATFLVFKSKLQKQLLNLSRALFYIQFTVSSFFLVAYVENYEEIYINDIFSLAFPTALCFFILSIIQLKYLEFHVWPFKYFSTSNTTNKVVTILLPVFLLYFIVYQYFNHHLNLFTENQYAHPLFLIVGITAFYFIIYKVSKNINEELENSKSLFEGLFNNATVGLYQTTPSGKILTVNPSLVKMLGYESEKELLQVDLTKGSYVDYSKKEEFKSILEQADEISGFESEWITKQGKVITVREGAKTIKDENGTIIRYDGVVENITETKKNEAILHKMSKAINNSSDVIFMTNVEGIITFINYQFTNLYGYTAEEVLNKVTPRILKSGKQYDNFYRKIWKLLTHKRSIKAIHIINKTKDETFIDIESSIDPIIDENGTIIGFLGIQRDITERKRAETIQNIILNITNASQKEDNLNTIIHVVQKELARIVDTRNFYVALYNKENDTINRIFYQDEKDNIVNFPASKTATGMVIKKGKSYLLKEEDTIKLAKENQIDVVGEISKVWLGVPLIVEGKSIGAFVVQNYEDENAYSVKDIEVLEIISHQISISFERQQAKKILEEIQQKQRDILEKSTNLFYSHNIDHQLNYLSPQVKEILGYEVDEALVKWTELVSDHPVNTIGFEYTDKAIKTGVPQPPFELELVRKDGHKIWVEVREAPVVENGKTTAIVGSLNDITEQKRANLIQNIILNIANTSQKSLELEEIMQLIQNELNKIVDTKNFFIALYNEENDTIHLPYFQDEKDDIIDFPAGKTFTGIVIRKGESLLLTEDDMNRLTISGEIEIVGECSKIWLGVPLKIKDKVFGAFVLQSYDDINAYTEMDKEFLEIISHQISISIERKRNEENLIKAKLKAEENDRLKSAFLANMSHEIRTPMNSILGFSELLLNQELTEEKQEKYHEIVNNSGKRLMNLISDIVDISKIDARELKLNPTVFNLNNLMNQLQQQFSISPKNKNTVVTLITELEDENSNINIDETRLAQVLSNLLENALKFTKNGTVEFGYTIEKEVVKFYVKDSGVGINEIDHQHIFERFGQSNNEILKVKEGSGLGLSISKGIVELFGGKIWVESEPYKGATFYFTIPNNFVQVEQKGEAKKDDTIVESKTTKTILIAEDEETNFWFLEAALEGHPFDLIHVLNGKEAVEIMQTNHNIDLILMDFNMPVMNGMDATVEIRKTYKTIPIIAVTAYAMMADREKALEIGCTDYLSKPVSRDLLLEIINKTLSNKVYKF